MDRIKIEALINESLPEMSLHPEIVKPNVANCYYGYLCFHNENDCKCNHHGISLTGRKILIKKVKQMEKASKKM